MGDKRFESMDLLVADGLISMYIDLHAADYIKRMADEAIYEDRYSFGNLLELIENRDFLPS